MKKRYILLMMVSAANAQYDPAASEDVNETFDSTGIVLSNNSASSVDQSNVGGFPTLVMTGPFITSLGTGVNGEDESILEDISFSSETLGSGAQLNGTDDFRVADDFEVINGGWQIEEIEVYAYQTGQTASTITGVTMQIWDGNPNDPTSMVVFGDTTTNVLEFTANSGVLRVTETTTGTTDDRQITTNIILIGQFFPEGTYWVDYQFTGSGGSGPWVPPVTITGQLDTGNALQINNNAATPTFDPITDDGSAALLGMPILIRGTEPDLIFKDGFDTAVLPL